MNDTMNPKPSPSPDVIKDVIFYEPLPEADDDLKRIKNKFTEDVTKNPDQFPKTKHGVVGYAFVPDLSGYRVEMIGRECSIYPLYELKKGGYYGRYKVVDADMQEVTCHPIKTENVPLVLWAYFSNKGAFNG